MGKVRILTTVLLCVCASYVMAQETQGKMVLTFDEAVRIGLRKNVALNQQKNFLEVNEAQRLGAYGNFLPNLSLTGNFTHQEGQQQNTTSGNLEDLSTDYFGGQFNTSLTLFNGLRNINNLSAANNQVLAQSYFVKRSSQDVVSFVASQYLQVLLDQQLLTIAEENFKLQEALAQQMQAFYDAGSRPITDAYNQDALLKGAQVSFVRAKNNLLNDKATLAQTLQLDPSETFDVVYPSMPLELVNYNAMSLDSLIAIALENRPDWKQQDHQVEANKYSFRATFGSFLPSLTGFASYGSFYYSLIPFNFGEQFRTLNPSIQYGANITIPIFTRFQNRTQRVVSKITYENSLITQENLLKTIKIDVQRALNNLINAAENYRASLAQFEAGDLALRTQKESYELGASDQVALAQATQTYVSGAASKAQAEVTLLFNRILLDYSLGIISPDDFSSGQ